MKHFEYKYDEYARASELTVTQKKNSPGARFLCFCCHRNHPSRVMFVLLLPTEHSTMKQIDHLGAYLHTSGVIQGICQTYFWTHKQKTKRLHDEFPPAQTCVHNCVRQTFIFCILFNHMLHFKSCNTSWMARLVLSPMSLIFS